MKIALVCLVALALASVAVADSIYGWRCIGAPVSFERLDETLPDTEFVNELYMGEFSAVVKSQQCNAGKCQCDA